MDITKRQITKIAREASRFTARMLRSDGLGAAEYDYIHVVRKHPGITQSGIRELLGLDKGASARRAASLEAKGYLIREPDPDDKRSCRLYATQKAEQLKSSKARTEALYYEWLAEALSGPERAEFARLLNIVYERSRAESQSGFLNLTRAYEIQRDPSVEALDDHADMAYTDFS